MVYNPNTEVDMKPINVGLLGLGTVGSGVARVLSSHHNELEEKIGAPVVLRGQRRLAKSLAGYSRTHWRSHATASSKPTRYATPMFHIAKPAVR